MKRVLLLFAFFIYGVFGESVSVTEGDSVTLHTGLTEIQKDDVIEWRFGAEGTLIARINKEANTHFTFDNVSDGRFRDRLKLDLQTGDLTIRNVRTQHSGLYEVTNSLNTLNKICNISALPVDEVKSVSVMVGDSVTLHIDPIEIQRDDVIRWKFEHQNAPIAEMIRTIRNISTSDGPDGRFRRRLKLDYWTGSLTIKNTRTNHSGRYVVDIISTDKHTIHKTFNVNVSGVIKSVSELEGKSIFLQTGLTEIQSYDSITWMFEDIVIAEICKLPPSLTQQFYKYDGADERFRDRLQLDNQTGSLTVTESEMSNSGLYDLRISRSRHSDYQRFNVTVKRPAWTLAGIVLTAVTVFGVIIAVVVGILYRFSKIFPRPKKLKPVTEMVSVKRGDDVTPNMDAELQTGDHVLWMFGDEKSPIAEIKEEITTSDGPGGRFRNRLMLDRETGSLTIRDTQATDSGVYTQKIKRNGESLSRSFRVTVFDGIVPVSAVDGESVTLHTDTKLHADDEILWMSGNQDTVLAETKGGTRETTTHHGPDGRFRDRLKLDHQTGSLTITNTRTTDSGEYKLQIIRSGHTSLKLFCVSVSAIAFRENMGEEMPFLQPMR